ncbi:hypothetical protein V2I01_36410 [Micromonospora sp. BRA006-A]|nr:hypothetical protein [Micromonospora sp. BRA006-A]
MRRRRRQARRRALRPVGQQGRRGRWTEQLRTTDLGLDREAIDQLDWTLRRVRAAELGNGWDSAGKTGTWQAGQSTTQNVHTWMVGWTGALASASGWAPPTASRCGPGAAATRCTARPAPRRSGGSS